MNYGGYGFGGGGLFNDPHPGFSGPMRFAPVSPPHMRALQPRSVPSGGGAIGSLLSRGVNWLTDADQGMNRQLLLTNALGTLASVYGQHKADRRYDEEVEREEEREREARERYDSWNPVREQVLGSMLARRASRTRGG